MADAAGSDAAPELVPSPSPPPLPSYSEMILEAIDALDNANGSNETAISGYLKNKYRANLPSDHTSLLTINLDGMKSSGELFFARNNYFRPDGDDEEVKEEEPSATTPAGSASPLRPDGYKDSAVDEDSTGVFDAAYVYVDIDDFDAQLGLPASVRDALAPSVTGDDIGVPAPAADGVAADDIDVHAPAPVVTADAAAGPVKRGRGRPPKPKVAVADSPAETSLVASDAVAGRPAKRGRGRPPKPKDPAATAGRPPKPKDPVTETIAWASSGMLSPRGRPPKAKVEEAPSTDVPVKRGRGRPPQGEALMPAAVGEPSRV